MVLFNLNEGITGAQEQKTVSAKKKIKYFGLRWVG
jgi:hypothetical protein